MKYSLVVKIDMCLLLEVGWISPIKYNPHRRNGVETTTGTSGRAANFFLPANIRHGTQALNFDPTCENKVGQ